MKTLQACFVLISDDVLLAQKLSNALQNRATLQVFATLEQAQISLRSTPVVDGIVLDQSALGVDAVRAVQKLRAARPLCSLLFVASRLEVSIINSLQALRIQLLVRPLPNDALTNYVDRSLATGRVTPEDIQQWVERLSSDCRLSAADRALIPLILEHESEEIACKRLGLDRAALERGLRRIVKKCGVRNTDRLARNLLRDALLFSRKETSDWIDSPKFRAAV